MTGVLAWKVYREQRLIWVAMAALALVLLVLQVTVLEPDFPRYALCIFFGAIAYTHGLVAGAILLAGEREGGTAPFLESLPVERLPVWRVKCVTGTALVLIQVLFLWAVLLGANAIRSGIGVLLTLTAMGVLGFGWGLFFSGRARTSMGAILGALLAQAVAMPLALGLCGLLIQMVLPRFSEGWFGSNTATVCLCVLVGEILIFASGVGEARQDRVRRLERRQAAAVTGWRSELAVLIWLNWRQSGRVFKWLALGALAAGSLLPLGVAGWPLLTLLLGVIAGIAAFAGEQQEGAGRFLSEQRLPPGKVWLVKVGGHLVLAIGVALLLLIPASLRLGMLALRRQAGFPAPPSELEQLEPFLQIGPYLTLWLGYGFSVGCFFGLLLSKPIVAGAIAGGSALMLAGMWAPSLLVGGLHHWQIWGVPVLLLVAVRVLLWPWATGRLGSARALLRLGTLLTVAALWFTAAILYRVGEVPLVPESLDLEEFGRTVEADRRNEAGPKVRSALRQVGKIQEEHKGILGKLGNVPHARVWSAQDGELSAFLDEAFRLSWADDLAKAAGMPLGVIDDIQSQTEWVPKQVEHTSLTALMLAARGLQQQARGDGSDFIEQLRIGLALVRQVRHLQTTDVFQETTLAQLHLENGTQRWLERLGNRPELLRRVLDLLLEQEVANAKEAGNLRWADYQVGANLVKEPEALLKDFQEPRSREEERLNAMLAFAWRTPWEQARLQRLARLLVTQQVDPFSPPPPFAKIRAHFASSNPRQRPLQDRLLAIQLLVALRLYLAETGHPAKSLEDLMPKVLTSVPVDPRTGGSIYYRLSQGEELNLGTGGVDDVRKVLAGQGILAVGNRTFLVPLPVGR